MTGQTWSEAKKGAARQHRARSLRSWGTAALFGVAILVGALAGAFVAWVTQ